MFEKLFVLDQSVFNHKAIAQRGATAKVFFKIRRLKILRCNTREVEDEELELV
jgi:hypothetical protein